MAKPVGHAFLQATRHKEQGPSDQQRGKPAPPLHLPCTGKPHDLPPPSEMAIRSVDVRALMEERASVRDYAESPLTLSELSYLLWCTQGVKETHGRNASIRTASASELLCLKGQEFQALLDGHPDIRESLLSYIAKREAERVHRQTAGGRLL